jgi:hypothetical protein
MFSVIAVFVQWMALGFVMWKRGWFMRKIEELEL